MRYCPSVSSSVLWLHCSSLFLSHLSSTSTISCLNPAVLELVCLLFRCCFTFIWLWLHIYSSQTSIMSCSIRCPQSSGSRAPLNLQHEQFTVRSWISRMCCSRYVLHDQRCALISGALTSCSLLQQFGIMHCWVSTDLQHSYEVILFVPRFTPKKFLHHSKCRCSPRGQQLKSNRSAPWSPTRSNRDPSKLQFTSCVRNT